MGDADGSVASLWRYELEKSGIEFDEIVLIGNNLGELDKPEFIPNVFQLIGIVKKVHDDPEVKISHERITNSLPHMPSKKEIERQRTKTADARNECINTMKTILN